MGQRHQIFVKGFVKLNSNTNTLSNTHISVFHHQWLFGSTVIQNLRNFITFIINTESYKHQSFRINSTFQSSEDLNKVVKYSYSFFPERGYYSKIIDLNQLSIEDNNPNYLLPDYQANNDGQTFVDLTSNGKIKIGFSFDRDTSMLPLNRNFEKESEEINVYKWNMLTLKEYINLYYDVDLILKDKNNDYFETVQQVLEDIDFLEKNTENMTQTDLFNMYPHLKNQFDEMKVLSLKSLD